MSRPAMARAAVFALTALVASPPGLPRERYHRDWSNHPGMPTRIWDVTHDERGFLWLSSEEGVHRFDGRELVPWLEEPQSFEGINRGPQGRQVTFTEQGRLYEKTLLGFERVDAAGEGTLRHVYDADFGADGSLWVCDGAGLFLRNPEGAWSRIETSDLADRVPIRVRPAPDRGAYIGTREGDFVRVFPDGTTETWWSDPTGSITRIAVKDQRTQAFALRFGPNHGIYQVQDGRVRALHKDPPIGRRWTGLAFRGNTLWAAHVSGVLAIHLDGGQVERLGPREGFHPGGELVVDHENNLWLTSFRGLLQFPEPDVVIWAEMDGTRRVHRVGDDIVAARWRGPHRFSGSGAWTPMTPEGYAIFDSGGVSPWSTSWFVAVQHPVTPQQRSALLEIGTDGWTHHVTRDYGVFQGAYATDASGTFWIAFHDHLWRLDRRGTEPREVAPLFRSKAVLTGLHVGQNRVRLTTRDGEYCEGALDDDRSTLSGPWVCESVEGAGGILSYIQVDDGVPWLGSWNRGVLRRSGDGWETVVDADVLGTPTIRGLSHSPSGGVWVVTYRERVRVRVGEQGPEVLERLGPWVGVPDWMAFDILEEPDGTLWISGMTSAIQVPASSRQRPTTPPRVYATGFLADGRELAPAHLQRLPATVRRIALKWSAPTYRDPSSVRFQVRLKPQDEWLTTRERAFQFVDLRPGDYHVEVRASLDGRQWSEVAADFRFAIRLPAWRRPGFWAAVIALGAIAAVSLQWLRARQRARLERQRTEIAMNLHDELGAGLGSIGLLTDVASDGSINPAKGRDVAARIGEISRRLSRSLSDIVWTLRTTSADLEGFAQFLRQRASDLFDGIDTRVEFDFPDPLPPVEIELAVRRQIHAIASEALHNAAKHARASRVRVGLRREKRGWLLSIADDGRGFEPERESSGLGLESMKKRAALVGAKWTIRSASGEGCRIELRFRSRVGRRR